jgi:hypothetical protein
LHKAAFQPPYLSIRICRGKPDIQGGDDINDGLALAHGVKTPLGRWKSILTMAMAGSPEQLATVFSQLTLKQMVT